MLVVLFNEPSFALRFWNDLFDLDLIQLNLPGGLSFAPFTFVVELGLHCLIGVFELQVVLNVLCLSEVYAAPATVFVFVCFLLLFHFMETFALGEVGIELHIVANVQPVFHGLLLATVSAAVMFIALF